MKDVPDDRQTVQDFFEAKLKPVMQTNGGIECGKLQRATVVLQGESGEIEVDELSDEAAMYLHMGLSKVLFYVEQAVSESCRASERNVGDALVRQEPQALPMWSHQGRPAVTALYKTLSDLLRKDGLGFAGSYDLRVGGEWMLALVEVLYRVSPFHEKMKLRGYGVPKVFQFSSGANDFKKKSKAAPILTQDFLQQVCCTHTRFLADGKVSNRHVHAYWSEYAH